MNPEARTAGGLPLAARMALVIGSFGLVGSAALVWWVLADEAALSRGRFLDDGRSNAAFIARTGLPASAQMARQLSEVLGIEVRFRKDDGNFIPPLPDKVPWKNLITAAAGEEVVSRDGWERLALPVRNGEQLWLVRPAVSAWQGVLRPGAITGLAVFWGALLALALGIGRTVVRPVRGLARALPGLSGDAPLAIPASARRRDEIGALAEGLSATHTQLVAERRKRLEAERMALLGRMAAGLAHEINNPAAAIRLHAQLLGRTVEASSTAGESAQTIALEAGRIEELVNQWLFLSRPAPPQRSRVMLSQLLTESVAAAGPAAEHAGVELRIAACPDDAAVAGDFRRLRQVMSNLLTNAIHASPEGGTITLEVRPAEVAGSWEILCRDEGPGLSSQTLTRGTELFYSEKEGGLGIGLSVSAEIATAHGGRLTLANERAGALVTLQLPAATDHEV